MDFNNITSYIFYLHRLHSQKNYVKFVLKFLMYKIEFVLNGICLLVAYFHDYYVTYSVQLLFDKKTTNFIA